MNPVQIVEAARPEVGAMPATDRRHLRERIFDVAMRSQTEHGAVEVNSPNTRAANALRLAVLALLGAAAVGGLLYSASRETPGSNDAAPPSTDLTATSSIVPTVNTIAEALVPTIAPTTTMPPVAGSTETPLLLPPERNRLDALTVTRAQLGASGLMLRAPDLSIISLFEIDGLAPVAPATEPAEPAEPVDPEAPETTTTTTIPRRQFAGVTVEQPEADEPGRYRVDAPCGTVTVIDIAGKPAFRPEITQLFDSMQIIDGVIDITLPAGWDAISAGPSTDEFLFGLPVEIDGRNVTISLAQYPNGNIALATNDQRQYSPATFDDQPAWIHRDPEDPESFDIVTMIGTTAVRISASGISLPQTEAVIAGLTPGDVDEWTNRFGTLPVDVDPDIRTCPAQPEFRLS